MKFYYNLGSRTKMVELLPEKVYSFTLASPDTTLEMAESISEIDRLSECRVRN